MIHASAAPAGSRCLVACFLVLLLIGTRTAAAQDAPRLTEWSSASVVTVLPGDPLYSSFGHTAIRIRDDSAGFDVGYNFGTFDFDEEGFYLKFLQGKLDYVLARNRFDDVLYAYQMEHRPIIEQELNLSVEARQDLFDRLEINHLPENRSYRYEFLYDNCSTRPRDVIEAVWGYELEGGTSSDVATFRSLIDWYLADKPWTRLGIDVLMGSPADAVASPRDRMFLPDELLAAVDLARSADGQRLSQPPDTLYWPADYSRWNHVIAWPAVFGWTLLIVIAALSAFATGHESIGHFLRRFDGVFFLTIGLLGLVIALLWLATEHTVTKSNWNILWALPSHLAVGWVLLRAERTRWRTAYLWFTLALLGVILVGWFWIPQDFNPWLVPFLGIALIRAGMNIRPART